MAFVEWNRDGANRLNFGAKGRVITPGGSDLDPIAKCVVMTSAGDITIVPDGNADNTAIAFTGCNVGFIPPYIVRRVTACTGTCAAVDA